MVPTDAQPLPCAQVVGNARLPGLMLASALYEMAELGQPLCSPQEEKSPRQQPKPGTLGGVQDLGGVLNHMVVLPQQLTGFLHQKWHVLV